MGTVDYAFWRNRRVLITGHTGFKGGWLSVWLSRMGAQVVGIAMPANNFPNFCELASVEELIASSVMLDIRDAPAVAAVVREVQPEVVIHLAAQSLVQRSYTHPQENFATNVMGTVNLLDALRDLSSVRVAVMVTTDKVYAERELALPYIEADTLGGHDPYSTSKAASELIIDGYRRAFLAEQGIQVASARAGNVIGGGDWSANRLIPDAVRAWQDGVALDIRRPDSVRPWQHVLEPLAGYLVLAQHLWKGTAAAAPYNFGPSSNDTTSVRHLVNIAANAWGDNAHVTVGDGTSGPHEAGQLTLNTERVKRVLGLAPRWNLEVAVVRTIAWYRANIQGHSALALCHSDIDAYLGNA